MVDLNLWRLEYADVSFDFGTHESGYPFTKQVKVGPATLQTDDLPHPLTDGITFGIDRTRGRQLIFNGAHFGTDPLPTERRWTAPLDSSDAMANVWDARAVRTLAGAVAQLSNVDRERCVYGRPRNYDPTHDIARAGWSTYSADFVTADDKFYALTENMVSVGIPPTPLGGYTFSATFPMSTFGVTQAAAPTMQVGGTKETWGVVAFVGPCNNPSVTVKDEAGATLFTIGLQTTLTAGATALVDCRPWSRGVTLNGKPANGLLRASTKLDECRIPPGQACKMTATGIVPAGGASATIWWRDAFSSL